MGKTIIYYVEVRDQDGVVQTGETIKAAPFGTSANWTYASNLNDGRYKLTFDPAVGGSGIMSRYYDIYNGPTKVLDKVYVGEWAWFVKLTVDVTPKVILFSDASMKDENNDSLPTTIPNVKITKMYEEKDLPFFIHTVTTTGFTIEASSGGGGKLPVDVWLKIQIGEA